MFKSDPGSTCADSTKRRDLLWKLGLSRRQLEDTDCGVIERPSTDTRPQLCPSLQPWSKEVQLLPTSAATRNSLRYLCHPSVFMHGISILSQHLCISFEINLYVFIKAYGLKGASGVAIATLIQQLSDVAGHAAEIFEGTHSGSRGRVYTCSTRPSDHQRCLILCPFLQVCIIILL